MSKFLNISTDNTLGGNSPSNVIVSSQKAIKEYIDNHGGGGSATTDDETIITNASDELEVIGTKNKNTVSGATENIYDWIGTLAEYTSQAVATNHPDWICYITDDISGGVDVYTKAEVDTLLAGKYSTSNPSGYISGINSGDVTTALGYTPYNSSNPSGYQTASDVSTSISAINALTKIPSSALTYNAAITLDTNTAYTLTLSGDVTFTLPNPETGKLNQIEVQLYMATAYTIGLGTSYYFGEAAPDMSEAGYYSIMYEYDWLQSHWVVGALKKGAAS